MAQQGGLADAAAAQQAGRAPGREVEREVLGHDMAIENDVRRTHEKGRRRHRRATSPYAGINRIRFGVVLPDLSAAWCGSPR